MEDNAVLGKAKNRLEEQQMGVEPSIGAVESPALTAVRDLEVKIRALAAEKSLQEEWNTALEKHNAALHAYMDSLERQVEWVEMDRDKRVEENRVWEGRCEVLKEENRELKLKVKEHEEWKGKLKTFLQGEAELLD